jgi:hypothetical protein
MLAFQSLKWFRYHWNEDSLVNTNDIGLSGLLDNLQLQKTTLETIILDTGKYEYFSCPWEIIQPVGSFREFSKLRVLEISTPLLIGSKASADDIPLTPEPEIDIDDGNCTGQRGEGEELDPEVASNALDAVSIALFPPSLEVLRIHAPAADFTDRILTWLANFIPRIKDRTPRLRVLDLTAFKMLAGSSSASEDLILSLLRVISRHRATVGTVIKLPSGVHPS